MSVSNDGCANVRSTSSIAAVTDTITEVDVLAEAGNIGGGTSKTWSQGEHVVDASLTTRWELVDLRHGHGKGAGEESH